MNPSLASSSTPHQAKTLDRLCQAWVARFSKGLSPMALSLAFVDWLTHLAFAPGKQQDLVESAGRKALRWALYAGRAGNPSVPPTIEPLPQDSRFDEPDWQRWPFCLLYQAFLLNQQWWHRATTDVPGMNHRHEAVVSFTVRQILDLVSPSNFPLTNPEVLRVTLEQGGANLFHGLNNLAEDWEHIIFGKKPVGTETFQVGKNVAVTPGKVVLRNRLIELIQYAPARETVHAEPILIVPAWIMKYYILDLSPQNSLVKYLVDHGHTVFMLSWKNPNEDDRDLGMEDYRHLGIMESLKTISAILPDRKIHAVGYCLGGTLLAIAAAAMAREHDDRIRSLTFLATEVDFSEAGELMLFIDDSQVAFLESLMWDQGYLDTKQMSGAFQLLRSNDLIWSNMVHQYLLGERQPMTDLMAWNADTTRMPYRMHSEYLHCLFLDNDFAAGRYQVGGRPVTITDIRAPIFAVATVRDHVAPWRSVYKLNLLTDTDVTFVLTAGGHNAGIVSEPGHPHRRFQIASRAAEDSYIDPETWQASTSYVDGSWWPAWENWIVERSGTPVPPPPFGAPDRGYPPIADAPGTYVLQS